MAKSNGYYILLLADPGNTNFEERSRADESNEAILVSFDCSVAKVIKCYVRDFFQRTVKRKGCTPGQVGECLRCLKHSLLDVPVRNLEYRKLEKDARGLDAEGENDSDMHRRRQTGAVGSAKMRGWKVMS